MAAPYWCKRTVGVLIPIIISGACGKSAAPDQDVCKRGCEENLIPASVKACRITAGLENGLSGMIISIGRVLELLTPPPYCVHPASRKIFENCAAKKKASGSPATNLILTTPGCFANSSVSVNRVCGDRTLHWTSFFRRSVSSSACAVKAFCFSSSICAASMSVCARPAANPAVIPAVFASATFPATSTLYASKTRSSWALISASHFRIKTVPTTTAAPPVTPTISPQTIATLAISRHQRKSWPIIPRIPLEDVALIVVTTSIAVMFCAGICCIVNFRREH